MGETLRDGEVIQGMRQSASHNSFSLAAFGPPLTLLILILPIFCGLLGTILPALGYLPALGGHHLTLAYFQRLFAEPGIEQSVMLSLRMGIFASLISLLLVILFVASSHGTRGFERLQTLISPLLSIPHAAAAFGLEGEEDQMLGFLHLGYFDGDFVEGCRRSSIEEKVTRIYE